MDINALKADLAKYEEEILNLNKRLQAMEEEKLSLLTHGRRIEGIVAYLRGILNVSPKNASVPAEAAEASAPAPASN